MSKQAGVDFVAGETVAACGHVIPAWHESAWWNRRGLFCSLNCLADDNAEHGNPYAA